MTTDLGLKVRRKSATPSSGTSSAGAERNEVSKLVDIDLCIGCKACEVACKEWNDLEAEETFNFGSYQSHEDLTANTWDLMRFNEVDLDNGDLAWLIRKDSCMHCDEPGLPARLPGSGRDRAVRERHRRLRPDEVHRLPVLRGRLPVRHPPLRLEHEEGLQVHDVRRPRRRRPGAGLRQGVPDGRDPLRHEGGDDSPTARRRSPSCKDAGFDDAMLYDPGGVGGLHMMYVVPRGEMLGDYGLPADPEVKGNVSFIGGMKYLRRVGAVAIWAGVIGGFLYWLRTGRRPLPAEGVAVAEAERIGAERAAAQREAEAAGAAAPPEAADDEAQPRASDRSGTDRGSIPPPKTTWPGRRTA